MLCRKKSVSPLKTFKWRFMNIETTTRFSLHKICENTGFHWSVFSGIRTESVILSLYGRMRTSKNLYIRIFYAVFKVVLLSHRNLWLLITFFPFSALNRFFFISLGIWFCFQTHIKVKVLTTLLQISQIKSTLSNNTALRFAKSCFKFITAF